MGQTPEVGQNHYLPLLLPQRGKGLVQRASLHPDGGVPDGVVRVVGWLVHQIDIVIDLPPPPSPHLVNYPVVADAKEPGGNLAPLRMIAGRPSPDAEKRVLGNLFSGQCVSKHACGQGVDSPGVSIIQGFQRPDASQRNQPH